MSNIDPEQSTASDSEENNQTIAVSQKEYAQFGCPYCGYRSARMVMSGSGAALLFCGDCQNGYIVLGDGLEVSPIMTGEGAPKRRKHPRYGIPSHGAPDKQPEGGGEFFYSRGLGREYIAAGCFVCGNACFPECHNVAAFVQCKASGERIIEMFEGKGAEIDFRPHEPDRIQVKIGTCRQHLPNLEALHKITKTDHVITSERLEEVRKK